MRGDIQLHAGSKPTLEYFQENFGFTERETVTILGAHTLGRAEYDYSAATIP